MQLDEGTVPKTEIKGSYLVTYEPMYIRNADGTCSINPKATVSGTKNALIPLLKTWG